MDFIEMEKKKRVAPIIKAQKEALIDFMAQHPNLRSGRFTATFSFKDAKNLWHQLAEVLNAIPGGSQKDWSQWRKVNIINRLSLCIHISMFRLGKTTRKMLNQRQVVLKMTEIKQEEDLQFMRFLTQLRHKYWT